MPKEKKAEKKAEEEAKDDNKRIIPDFKTDDFGEVEQKDIVNMVKLCLENSLSEMSDWIEQRRKDLQMYEGEKPSIVEDLDKEDWMSDRNLGMTEATCDAYQATLLATCYNEERIHWKTTKDNTADRSDNIERFTKWALGPQEANVHDEIDDFIHNRITQGVSYLKIGWKVWYKWLDRRIPKFDKTKQPHRFIKYEIETEKFRQERGYMENIDDVSDLIYPTQGDDLQTKPHLIHRIRTSPDKIVKKGESKDYINVDEKYKTKVKKYLFDSRLETLKKEKMNKLGLKQYTDMTDTMMKHFDITIFEWYGMYQKVGGNEEEYRFTIDTDNSTFLAGKPLRKINRKAKRPFVGGGLIRRPGLVQGKSLPYLIADPSNAFNNTWNQKSDFQYVENCPYFFYEPNDPLIKSVYELAPGRGYPVENPSNITFPKNARSMGWAQSDFEILFQVIERLTGAASYFMTNKQGVSGTATRDAIINEKSETRFGLMVKRLIIDLSEAITMFINQYQDWAPPDLGERVLGEDGKQLFPNFSLETLMGDYDAWISPDIISGSKTLEREIAIWGVDRLEQSVWFDPMINPRGNWELWNQAGKKMGMENLDSMMPPKPEAEWSRTEIVTKKWDEIKQGVVPELKPGDDVVTLFMGFSELKSTKYETLDEEYQPVFDVFYFKLGVQAMQMRQKMMEERMSTSLAMNMVSQVDSQSDKTPKKGGAPINRLPPTTGEQAGEAS